MANLKSDGRVFDANLIIETGSTFTAGSLIWADISGTNVVRAVRNYSGTTTESNATFYTSATGRGSVVSLDTQLALSTGVFLGVLCSTQTGVPNLSGGHQTGVAWYTQGVFDFNTTPTASAALRVGMPVYASNWETVFYKLTGVGVTDATGTSTTGTNTSGVNPIGIIEFIPGAGVINTNTVASKVRVRLLPHFTVQRG